jgi:hypothetical protein
MTKFEISLLINKPVEVITKALTNPENHPYWTTDLDKFEVIKGGPHEVGSIAHLHYSQKGRSYVMEDKLIYCEPGKKYISIVTGDVITAEVETILQPFGHKTEMSLKWSGRGKILFLKIFLPLFRWRIKKLASKDLETFKKLVEEKGVNFSTKVENKY